MDKSYQRYSKINERRVSNFDYLCMMKELENLHEDFMLIFASLFNPRIFVRDRGYFVKEAFIQGRYDKMVEDGVDLSDIPYWSNIVELTSLLGDEDYARVAEIGAVIRDCWNAKLNKQFPNSGFAARLMLWEDLGEVLVTLCKSEAD